MIPKIIHYCWFGPNKIGAIGKRCIKSWKKLCPDYELIFWNESNYNVNKNVFCKSAYESGAWAFVSDYARLDIVQKEGGFYLDLDVELLKPLDELIDNECFLGVQQIHKKCTTGLGFGAQKGSVAVKRMLECYDNLIYTDECAEELACPTLNDLVARELGFDYQKSQDEIVRLDGLTVYPCRYFDPISMGDDSLNLLCDDTISINRAAYSWGGREKRLRRLLVNRIGLERSLRIKQMLYKIKRQE